MDLKAKRSSLTDQVTELLQRYIEERNLQPGDMLPTELELVDTFGVSRTVIREGLRAAAALGLIDTQSGRRSRVAGLSGDVLSHFFNNAVRLDTHAVTELLEVREALETYAVQLAARERNVEQLQQLHEHLERMGEALGRDAYSAFVDADVEFHHLLALMSGNDILLHLLEALRGVTHQSISSGLSSRSSRRALNLVQELHTGIYAAVEAQDAAGAALAMRRHFREAISALRDYPKKA